MEILNYTDFMAQNPSLYRERRGIKFYEHPVYGGDSTCIAVIGNVAFDSGFYDPWLCTGDIDMVWENFEEWQKSQKEN